MSTIRAREPGWADVLEDHAAQWATARRLVGQLGACEAAALAFCRLLERWARGDAFPSTPGGREAALRHAADRAETALTGLDHPLDRYLLELEADRAEGSSWYGGPGAGELIDWAPILKRAGVIACATRVASAPVRRPLATEARSPLTIARPSVAGLAAAGEARPRASTTRASGGSERRNTC